MWKPEVSHTPALCPVTDFFDPEELILGEMGVQVQTDDNIHIEMQSTFVSP